jgi:HK97 family phage prohead protease
MMNRELRAGLSADVRDDADGVKVEGYAAIFDEVTDIFDYRTGIGGMFREVIAPGAFTDAVGRDDVVFLINHEGLPLARSRAGQGTLSIAQDDRGLKISATLDPNDPDVMKIRYKMQRGDLDKMSFAFNADLDEWDLGSDTPLRTIKRATLYDVSVVNDPAYGGTEIALRSLDASRKGFDAASFRTMQKARLMR